MKRLTSFSYLALASLGFVLSQTVAFAHLQPLSGSEWAKIHPGLLPYEECHLNDHIDNGVSAFIVTLSMWNVNYIECTAPTLNLTYRIPVNATLVQGYGIHVATQLNVSLLAKNTKIENLDGKTVKQALGKFWGVEGALGVVLLAGRGDVLWNNNKVKLTTTELSAGQAVSLVLEKTTLYPREYISMSECFHDFEMIIGNPSRDRTRENCNPYVSHDVAKDLSEPSEPRVKVKWKEVFQLEFQKI